MTESIVSIPGCGKIRKKPESLLMMGTLKATGATLELALIDLRKQCEATSKWLERLNTSDVEFGTPRFPDQVEPTTMSLVRERMGRKPAAKTSAAKEVIIAYTAVFPLTEMTADEVLIFTDRLRFESANSEEDEHESAAEPPLDTQQQIEAMMAQVSGEHTDDASIRFMFRSRLTEADEQNVMEQAMTDAHAKATKLATAAGRKLGPLHSISQYGHTAAASAASMMKIQRQTMMPEIGETSLGADESDILSESPRPTDFCVTVHVTYLLT